MKPITKQELAQLTKMNPGVFITSGKGKVHRYTNQGTSKGLMYEGYKPIENNNNKEVKPSLFERFYDYMSNLINGNKSIATAELKSFR